MGRLSYEITRSLQFKQPGLSGCSFQSDLIPLSSVEDRAAIQQQRCCRRPL